MVIMWGISVCFSVSSFDSLVGGVFIDGALQALCYWFFVLAVSLLGFVSSGQGLLSPVGSSEVVWVFVGHAKVICLSLILVAVLVQDRFLARFPNGDTFDNNANASSSFGRVN